MPEDRGWNGVPLIESGAVKSPKGKLHSLSVEPSLLHQGCSRQPGLATWVPLLSPGTGLRVQARQLLRSARITVSIGALLLSLFPGSVQVGGQRLLEDLKLVWKVKKKRLSGLQLRRHSSLWWQVEILPQKAQIIVKSLHSLAHGLTPPGRRQYLVWIQIPRP